MCLKEICLSYSNFFLKLKSKILHEDKITLQTVVRFWSKNKKKLFKVGLFFYFCKKKRTMSEPERTHFLRKLIRNPSAALSLAMITVAFLVAIFAYFIAPDGSPNANEQSVDIALQAPAFRTQQLSVCTRRTGESDPQSFFATLWGGKVSDYKRFSFQSYFFKNDSIFIEKWAGTDEQTGIVFAGDTVGFHLVQVLFPMSAASVKIKKIENGGFEFLGQDGGLSTAPCASFLQEKIIQERITSRTFWLGTDAFGRCMLSRLILGVRISLLVGCIAVLISLLLGVTLGAIAGYAGGRTDDLIVWLINTVWSIPTLLLVFAIVMAVGRNATNIYIAVGLTMWVDVARLVRGQVAALRKVQFVEAARSLGFGDARILFRHILPNVSATVAVVAAANFATAILVEAGLSYLGFGIQPPQPSWGTLLNENYGYVLSGKPALTIVPAVAIMLLVLAFNLLGNGIRDALDVRS